jgi:hypothetical protein
MKKIVLITLVLVTLALLGTMQSLAQSKAGTSAAPELLIPIGAKNVAMAGAGISSVNGTDAIAWNPAGLDGSENPTSALFSYRAYIADIGISYLAVGTRFEGFGSLGLSLRSFNIGTIPVTTEDQPDGNGQQLNPTFFTLGLTYSKQLSDRVSIGATTNLVSESFGGVSAMGIAFDVGVQYQNPASLKGLSLGVVVRNVGTTMQYGGSSLWRQASDVNSIRGVTYYKIEAASYQMPSVIDIGVGYKLSIDESFDASLSAAYENDNYGIDGYRIGGQLVFMNAIAVRAGYLYSTDHSGTVSIFQNYSLGAGINLEKLVNVGISFDYAYVPVQYFSGNHLLDIRMNF